VTDKLNIAETIRDRFTSAWEKEIAESDESIVIRKQFAQEKHIAFYNTSAALRSPINVSVKTSKTCKKARVQIKYAWHVESPRKQQEYGGERSYKCNMNGNNWEYQIKGRRLFCVFKT